MYADDITNIGNDSDAVIHDDDNSCDKQNVDNKYNEADRDNSEEKVFDTGSIDESDGDFNGDKSSSNNDANGDNNNDNEGNNDSNSASDDGVVMTVAIIVIMMMMVITIKMIRLRVMVMLVLMLILATIETLMVMMRIKQKHYIRFSTSKFEKVPQACNFITKETLAQVFSREFCEISKNTFLQNTSGRLLLIS